ncbi:hypothetical protein AALM74_09165 [Parabacteroides segnis]|uniref:hypothetical protein n=1 Tax=Parabacteroides segnis TaxID=2763058 RepID=UPI00351232D4
MNKNLKQTLSLLVKKFKNRWMLLRYHLPSLSRYLLVPLDRIYFKYRTNGTFMLDNRTVISILNEELTAIVRRYKGEKDPLDGIIFDARNEVIGKYLLIDPDRILQQLYICIDQEKKNFSTESLDLSKVANLFRESIKRNGNLRTISLY